MRRSSTLLFALTALLGLSLATPALAALGGGADSVNTDSSALRGMLRSTPTTQYDVEQISSGPLVVREYVTRSGPVFAVTWRGPTPPDLQQLLGSYFGRFHSVASSAHQVNPGIHRQLTINQPDLVIQAVGRLRDFQGIAYLPALVPEGVAISELQ